MEVKGGPQSPDRTGQEHSHGGAPAKALNHRAGGGGHPSEGLRRMCWVPSRLLLRST